MSLSNQIANCKLCLCLVLLLFVTQVQCRYVEYLIPHEGSHLLVMSFHGGQCFGQQLLTKTKLIK